MSVPIYYVCPHLLCLSPPIMSVPIFHVCPHLSFLFPPIISVPPIMSFPTYHVCPHLSCLSPPIMSVPTYHVCPHLSFFSDHGWVPLNTHTHYHPVYSLSCSVLTRQQWLQSMTLTGGLWQLRNHDLGCLMIYQRQL